MSPTDWLGLVNGLMLAALTIRMFWGWVFGREYTEQNLASRMGQVEKRIDAIDDLCTQHDKDLAVVQSRLNSRSR